MTSGMKQSRLMKLAAVNLISIVIVFLPATGFSVSGKLKARSEIKKAQQQLEMGEFTNCAEHAMNAKRMLENTSSQIEYILAICNFESGNYQAAQYALENYFEITPEKENDKQYETMITLIAENEVGLKGGTPTSVVGHKKTPDSSGASGSTVATKSSSAAIPAWKWISLAEAQANGIPVPFKPPHSGRVGKKVSFEKTKKGYYTDIQPGLLTADYEKTYVNDITRYSQDFLAVNSDGTTYQVMLKVESIAGEHKSSNKIADLPIHFMKYRKFPVSLLKTGISWTENIGTKYRGVFAVPAKLTVDSITNVNGHDCVKVSGYGKHTEHDTAGATWKEIKIDFCYDYNNGGYVNFRQEVRAFSLGREIVNIVEERNRISLTFD